MSGLVAIFGKKSEESDMEPLIESVKFRGTCKGVQADEDGYGMAILNSADPESESDISAALDGYMVFSEEEGTILQGGEGETRFCDVQSCRAVKVKPGSVMFLTRKAFPVLRALKVNLS